jgi:hypothetical protein
VLEFLDPPQSGKKLELQRRLLQVLVHLLEKMAIDIVFRRTATSDGSTPLGAPRHNHLFQCHSMYLEKRISL